VIVSASRTATLALCVLSASAGGVADGLAQGRSGPMSVSACGVLTADELETALGKKVRSRPVPASTPATIGVSVCMWASADGRKTLSVATHGPEAVKRTVARDLPTYFESLKTSNANLARRPAVVFPGIARRACYFVNPRESGDVILILRHDCVVTITAVGLTRDEAQKVAAAAGK
jgi:hypothetical protein